MPSESSQGKEPFPPPTEAQIAAKPYSDIHMRAIGLRKSLRAAWRRNRNHNRRIERDALWSSLSLDATCARVLTDPSALLSSAAGSLEARYEVQAGVYVVHNILPFTLHERHRLRALGQDAFERFTNEDALDAEPVLAERWHEWVWADSKGVPQNSVKALGASAILGEASERLLDASYEVLETLNWGR